jgi:hypothetical protein
MRRTSLLTLVIGLMLASIGVSHAQTQIVLMEHTNSWRYLLTNALPAANWFASNYPPANTWTSGRATFAFPATEPVPPNFAPINTVLATNIGSSYIQTFYFRTTVNLPTNPNLLISVDVSAVIDDGAAFYVNGREVTSARVRMPTGAINHGTSASAGGEVGTTRIDTFTIDPTNFVQGVNVIAVEVHQDGAASSDMVFGMRITASVGAAPVITSHPQDQEVDVPQPASFSVSATGTAPLTYRWYTNGVQVAGQTGPTYTINPTTLAMNGRVIHATVSNRFGLAISSNAVLTAVLDQTGPFLISANATSPTRIEATFNESLRPANPNVPVPTTNVNNYVVHVLGTTNTIRVSSLIYAVSRIALNLASPLIMPTDHVETNYVLCVYNMQDTKTNTTAQDCAGVGFLVTTNSFGLGQRWHFVDYMGDNTLHNMNWKAPEFDDSEDAAWGIGTALLFNDPQEPFANPCSPQGLVLAKGARTQYYRKRFTLGTTLASTLTATIRHVIDDGAVFYINGTEVARYNMPAGPIDYFTLASGSNFNPTLCFAAQAVIPGSVLRVGTNVLAVEVHQHEGDGDAEPYQIGGEQSDLGFDAELSFTYRSTVPIPSLNIARIRVSTFTNILVTWPVTPGPGGGTNWVLQHAVNIAGPWTTPTGGFSVSMGTNRYQQNIATLGPRRFYRLKNP